MTASTLTIARPDDWHLHLRDGEAMQSVVGATARVFARAVVMPNLKPPVATVAQAAAYRERIAAALPPASRFAPLMTLYLTDITTADEIARARASGFIIGVKYYPAGATTNSDSGVTDLAASIPSSRRWRSTACRCSARGSHRRRRRRVRSRTSVRRPAAHAHRSRFSRLENRARAHHDHGSGGLRRGRASVVSARQSRRSTCSTAAMHCSPAASGRTLLPAGAEARGAPPGDRSRRNVSGNPKYFLGTDSAPHARQAKESACCWAGCYSASAAIELYAEAFEEAGALDRLEAFASFHGADFYGLPRNSDTITLRREDMDDPRRIRFRRARGRSAAGGRTGVAMARCGMKSALRPRVNIARRSQPDRRCPPVQSHAGRGKSGLRRAGCWVTPRRNKSSRESGGKSEEQGHRDESRPALGCHAETGAGETRQPPSGATPSRRTMTLLAESAGRWLERRGNTAPRRMTAIGRDCAPVTEPGLSAGFDLSCSRAGGQWTAAVRIEFGPTNP